MDQERIIRQLAGNAPVFQSLLEGIPKEQYLWKPSPEKWCLLEVLCHLYDEEREDFRTRVRHVMEHPGTAPPSIDPAGWVIKRDYIGQNYEQKLDAFLEERTLSIQWLDSLENAPWQNAFPHGHFGPMSADYFLRNWLAHDYLHFRQIVRLKHQYLRSHTPQGLDYAGEW
ncbi:MAG: DinB family protein [Saprospiraceae bacterium]|nr:DinB family protein [Lewinella sp.]